MKNKIHLIMPMGGMGHRFKEKGINTPKPLIEINNKPFFWWATESIAKFVDVDITFVVLKYHVDNFNIDKIIRKYYPNANIVIIPEVLNGAVLTCLEGLDHITDNYPIIFNDCDHLFKCSAFNEYCKKGEFTEIDGALLTFKADDSKFSYLKYNDEGKIIGTIEKEVVSSDAICGAYYFKNKNVFITSAKEYLNYCNYNEYYISGIYNIMINNGKKINKFEVDFHLAFGTPEEYIDAKDSKYFLEIEK